MSQYTNPYSSKYTDPGGRDIYHQCVSCGVYAFDGGLQANGGSRLWPMPCSHSNINNLGLNDKIDYWIVYPGWKMVAYTDPNYGGGSTTIDNSTGSTILTDSGSINTASSIKVFFRGVEFIVNGASTYPPW